MTAAGRIQPKYLGLILEQDMTNSSMGKTVVKNVNAKLNFLYRTGAFFCVMSTALLQPHFDYACNAWYRSVDTAVKNKLQTAKNKTIRYLLKYDCRCHVGFSDFKIANYLDVKGRVDYRALSVIDNVFNNANLSYMCDRNRI